MKIAKRRNRYVIDFYDQDGRRRWESFKTLAAAKDRRDTLVDQLKGRTYVPPTRLPTFGELAEDWFASKHAHRPSSRAQWRTHLDVHLLPQIGHRRLDRVAVETMERVRDALSADLAPVSVNKVITTAAAVFKLALRRGLLQRNPAALVERLKTDAGEIRTEETDSRPAAGEVRRGDVLAPSELARLIAAADPGLYRTLLATACATGERIGELLAHTWGDLDLETGTLTVRRAVSWARVRKQEDAVRARFFRPKTKAGMRTLEVRPELAAVLRTWKVACPPSPHNLLFPGPDGAPLHRSTVLKRGFHPALRRAKLRHVTFHSLRHSYASALFAAGATISEVQHALGHASANVTLRVYTHFLPETKTVAVGTVARAILGGERMGSEEGETGWAQTQRTSHGA